MKNYRKYFLIPAPPDEVYRALTNPLSIQLWTGEKAVMSDVAGTEFSLWNGSISGKNIAFEEAKNITQEWYFGEQIQASIVTLTMHPQGNNTSILVEHTAIPDADYHDISQGWEHSYMASLIEFFEE